MQFPDAHPCQARRLIRATSRSEPSVLCTPQASEGKMKIARDQNPSPEQIFYNNEMNCTEIRRAHADKSRFTFRSSEKSGGGTT